MKLVLTKVTTVDGNSLTSLVPEDPNKFCYLLHLTIGYGHELGGSDYTVSVASPRWFEGAIRIEGPTMTRHWIFFCSFDAEQIYSSLIDTIKACEKSNLPDSQSALSRVFSWEFEDFGSTSSSDSELHLGLPETSRKRSGDAYLCTTRELLLTDGAVLERAQVSDKKDYGCSVKVVLENETSELKLEYFIHVCTPKWLVDVVDVVRWATGEHMLIVPIFDTALVRSEIAQLIFQATLGEKPDGRMRLNRVFSTAPRSFEIKWNSEISD